MFVTGSRGTFLFLDILNFFNAISSLYDKKHLIRKKWFLLDLDFFVISILLTVQISVGIPKLLEDIRKCLFFNDLNDSGRKELWIDAINMWKKNPMNIMFGGGLVSEFYIVQSFHGITEVFKVYHSTFFETLACFGIVGVLFLSVHLFEKYHQLLRLDRSTAGLILISYITVGLYGMIDNTYSMYYYMVPLVIIMATFDNCEKNVIFMEKC
ncbi:MAG: O-antigen ligase family protein [Clostridium sp.]|nr:MAG: O-antigen ligase family protein [Clostridium sp.]